MIIYGGFDDSRHRGGGVWALNLSGTPTWEPAHFEHGAARGAPGHVAIYDEALKRMVMFGGEVGTNQYSSEVWALNLDTTTPVAISLASTEAQSDLVRIAWSADGAQNLKSTVERSEGAGGEWTTVGSATPAGTDRLTFEDRTVVAERGTATSSLIVQRTERRRPRAVWVTVPVPAILSLTGASPNPSARCASAVLAAGERRRHARAVRSQGRRVAAREVGSLGPGRPGAAQRAASISRPASTWCASPRGPARSPPRPAVVK